MNNTADNTEITIDGVVYVLQNLSEVARAHIKNIGFTNMQISQLQSELAISNTARNGYLKILKRETAPRGKGA